MGQSAAGQVQAPPVIVPADAGGAGTPFPDPLASIPMASTAVPADGQADDLLSQLAGAEIDRMLAEADVEPAVDLPPAPPEMPRPEMPVAVEPARPAAAPVADVEPPPPVPASAAVAAPPPPAPPVTDPVASIDLNAVLSAAAGEPSATGDVPLDALAGSGRQSWVVRLLELASAPLNECPDAVRETIGKVAVVTLANAAAIFAYVMVFRRHG